MHYLTQYYKNLSEQLQEKIQYLEKILMENNGGSNSTDSSSKFPHRMGKSQKARKEDRYSVQKSFNEARDSSVDLDADEDDGWDGDIINLRHGINSAVDRGIEHIQRLHYHPKITPQHRDRLYDLDSLMMDYSDGSRMTRHLDELSDIHSEAHEALEQIQDIEDELER